MPIRNGSAKKIVEERGSEYGHPRENFSTIAALWTAWGARRGWLAGTLTPKDVAFMNILQKISREAHAHKQDNLDDIEGYIEAFELAKGYKPAKPAVCACGYQGAFIETDTAWTCPKCCKTYD